MIHIQLPSVLLERHKIIAENNGQLRNDIINLLEKEKYHTNIKVINYILENLERIVSCSIEDLKIIQIEYLNVIYELEEYFKLNTVKPELDIISNFVELHYKISKVFIKSYKNFTKRSNSSWNSYVFLKNLNQNVCPYCNANFIHTIQSNYYLSKASSRGMADLDHFLPKSIFPIFAVSLSNLVPSCIYCNQRFKSSYYTSFSRNYSPYDTNIDEKMRFKIVYSNEHYKSVYKKLKELRHISFSNLEKYYIKLISSSFFKDFKDFSDDSKKDFNKSQKFLEEIKQHDNDNHQTYIYNIIKFAESYFQKLNSIICSDFSLFLETKEKLILELEEEFAKLYKEREKYELQKNKNKVRRTNVTALKNIIEKNLKNAKEKFSINLKKDEMNEENTVNFVDVSLGKSTDYQIEIDTDCTSDNEKYMVYNNIALFQLEAVYNEYKNFINQRIEQSYILNHLYKSQLQSQFPNLFSEYSINDLSSLILVDKTNQKNEVLGKLIYELVFPNVKSQVVRPELKSHFIQKNLESS